MKSTHVENLPLPPVLTIETVVAATPRRCYEAWTTEEGIRSFLASECLIGNRPGDPYELYFDTDAPAGERGSEGARVLSADPPDLFSFSWNFPPSLPTLRNQRTQVALYFRPQDEGCAVLLLNGGYGLSPLWRTGLDYFRRAWGEVVFPRFLAAMEGRRIDLEQPAPDGYAQRIRIEVRE